MEAVASAVHDRMPVILDPDGYDLWLDSGMRDVADLRTKQPRNLKAQLVLS